MDVSPSPEVEGVDTAISAWVADECNRVLGKELTDDEVSSHPALAQDAKIKELLAWNTFKVFNPVMATEVNKKVVDTRWVLTWKMVEGKQCIKARLAAKGFQDPDLQEGLVDTSGCVSLRSSHLQVISLSALK